MKTLYLVLLSTLLLSCNKIKQEKGSIEILSTVYFNPSKSLEERQMFQISKLNFKNDSIIELVPDLYQSDFIKQVNFIKDTLYEPMGEIEIAKNLKIPTLSNKSLSVYNKKEGAIFSKTRIPNYDRKKNLSDTIILKKKYKRFEIEDAYTFARFYVYETDTIVPYSVYQYAEEDYDGRIERIDSYDKKKDIFVTMQLMYDKKIDPRAELFFTKK